MTLCRQTSLRLLALWIWAEDVALCAITVKWRVGDLRTEIMFTARNHRLGLIGDRAVSLFAAIVDSGGVV